MIYSPELIDAYAQILHHPEEYGADFPPLLQVIERSEAPTACHLIYDQFLKSINRRRDQLPKLVFYIVMNRLYGQTKCSDGNLGWFVRVKDVDRNTNT